MSTEKNASSPRSHREWWAYLLVVAFIPLLVALFVPSLTTPLLIIAGALTAAAVIASFFRGTGNSDWMHDL